MSGRISDVEVHPNDRSTWYVTAGSGGVWKTTNAGTTFTPVFDDQLLIRSARSRSIQSGPLDAAGAPYTPRR
jgi:hypothetical protein